MTHGTPTTAANEIKCPHCGTLFTIDEAQYAGIVQQAEIEQKWDAMVTENYRKARRAFLVGYDRSVPKLRQASHCIGCNQCVPHCPQNIRIPQELHRIDLFAEHLKQDNL